MYKLFINKPICKTDKFNEIIIDNLKSLDAVKDEINHILFSDIPVISKNACYNIHNAPKRANKMYVKYIRIEKLKKQTIYIVDSSEDE